MLQVIRDRFTGAFAGVLLGMLAVSFIFFGIGNFNFLNAGNVATVEGVDISVFQLENEYQNRLLQLPDRLQVAAKLLLKKRLNSMWKSSLQATRRFR